MMLIIVIIALYLGTCFLSAWLMDINNPNSYWYCPKNEEPIFQSILCALPLVNILFALIGSPRFEDKTKG